MELRAQDLRIGNWVNIGYDCKIVRIYEFGATLNTHLGVKKLLHFHEKYIRPIPLTEEILLKCGAVKAVDEWFIIDKCFQFFDNGFCYSAGLGYQLSQPIENLHQLQNLYFALTGQELNVKL